MRRRFERLATVSRESLQAKYPNLVFADHQVGDMAMEAVCAVESPRRVVLYLHGGAFSSARRRATATGPCA
ncbi:MAG: hypothetical protein ACOCXM_08115 [Myxococcota bacterium]